MAVQCRYLKNRAAIARGHGSDLIWKARFVSGYNWELEMDFGCGFVPWYDSCRTFGMWCDVFAIDVAVISVVSVILCGSWLQYLAWFGRSGGLLSPVASGLDVELIDLSSNLRFISCVTWFDLWIIYMLWMSNGDGVCPCNLGASFSFFTGFVHVCIMFPSSSVCVLASRKWIV